VWRRQYRSGELGSERSPAFIPLTLSSEAPSSAPRASVPSNPEARVEIALRNGRRLVVPANVDPEALARLLPVLEQA
jgi:transposase